MSDVCSVLVAITREACDFHEAANHVVMCGECQNVSATFMRIATSRAGQSSTPAKAAAARLNGRRGGRPRALPQTG